MADRLPAGKEVQNSMDQAASEDKKGGTGWVKVSRDIQDHWVWDEKPFSKGQAWIDLILLAKHSDGKFLDRRGNLIDGERGHIYRSERSLAERWGWSRKKVSSFLSQLAGDNMIEMTKKRASERTTIFIVNYNEFQSLGASKRASGEPVGSQSGASGEPVRNIYKNDKNVKNDKNEKEYKYICPEPGKPAPGCSDIFLPLVDGTFYNVPNDKIENWSKAFPAVDVDHELRKMLTWLDSNPKNQKTSRGVNRFINGWLSRTQDRGGSAGASQDRPVKTTRDGRILQ